jgi:hypothetical protein
MKLYVKIVVLFWLTGLPAASICSQTVKSSGALSFRCNGQLYSADSGHARAYSVKQTATGYINAANKDDMITGIEWQAIKGPGTFYITNKAGKADFTINHKTYSVKQDGDYVKIVISNVKQQGAFLLLSGTFEAQLQDKNGNKVKITEGRFETLSLS